MKEKIQSRKIKKIRHVKKDKRENKQMRCDRKEKEKTRGKEIT